MKYDQCRWCSRSFAEGAAITCEECENMPPILQLQADPFPTESDPLAEQGFIEQDASAPIKEQCEENARLMRRIASLEQTNRELRELVVSWQQVSMEAEQKAKRYEDAFAKMAECLNDLKG